MNDYEQMYKELKAAIRIHDSYTHEETLKHASTHMGRLAAANEIVMEANSFIASMDELERRLR